MRFVIQRVKHGSVTVEGKVLGKIGKGYVVLIGICDRDNEQIADKMIVMKEGRIVSQGCPEEVYKDRSLETAFGVKVEKLQTKEGEAVWHCSRFL